VANLLEHHLYGVRVDSDFSLFEHNRVAMELAPGGEETIELLQGKVETGDLPEALPLYTTHGRELVLETDRPLNASVPGQPWRLDVQGIVSFTWYGAQNRILYRADAQLERRLKAFWFVHIFLPLYLTLERGYDFIHSAAVEVDSQPLLFIAHSTGGKSTLADYFIQKGHALLSDDKVATYFRDGQYWAVPSYPYHRPWREAEVLGAPVHNFFARPAPIQGFYVLEEGEPDSEVQIEEVTGFRKFEALLPHYLFDFGYLREQRMGWLAQLADRSLVFRVRRPWDLGRISETYAEVCSQVAG
jgi:hypothetical protein